MTVMQIAKAFDLLPKDVAAYVQANATFPVKRNFQTGEIIIPDDVDVRTFIAPLRERIHAAKVAEEKLRLQQEQAEKERIQQQRNAETASRLMKEDMNRQHAEHVNSVAIEKLKKDGAEGYYQYKTISLVDADGGFMDASQLTANLNALGIEGWHLVAAYSNEIGRTSSSSGFGGISTSTNATIDQNILIFERFIKF